jgi:hypothetical protein
MLLLLLLMSQIAIGLMFHLLNNATDGTTTHHWWFSNFLNVKMSYQSSLYNYEVLKLQVKVVIQLGNGAEWHFARR